MRAVVIVDGLNLYHALKALGPGHTNLDISRISERLLDKSIQDSQIFYYTSPPEHLGGEAMKNYNQQIQRLANTGIEIVEGRFQRISARCHICGNLTQVNKEKETDVSIALKIVEAATDTRTGHILIYSADSDLTPALRLAKSVNKDAKITIAQTSAYLRNSHPVLMSFADFKRELRSELVHNYQFTLDIN